MLGGLLLDMAVVLVLAVAMAGGVHRGGLRELLALGGWLAGGILAVLYYPALRERLAGLVGDPALADWAAVLVILVVIAATIALMDSLLRRLLRRGGDHRDPLLGLVAGTARGVMLLLVALALAHRTSLPERQIWSQSQLLGHTEAMAMGMRAHLPAPFADWLAFSREGPDSRRVILNRDSRGHYVGLAYVNGLPVEVLVDTGATVMMIPAHLGARLGELPAYEPFNAKTVTGEVTARRTVIDALKIGPVVLHDVEASLVASPHDTVLLGMSVLNRLSFQQLPDGLLLEQSLQGVPESFGRLLGQ
ncbi:MAG: CvpA family protein [Candidatus Competibacteraceae bacterium]|nr:CvpA family protein [Candidatus Competibacteraceae bacterium]